MATAFDDQSIQLLLMGKTGNGKSATANSILGRPAFQTCSNADPGVWLTQHAFTKSGKDVLRVIEAPGMCHTEKGEAAKEAVRREFAQVIFLCKQGLDAMLLTIRYGSKYTAEDRRVVNTVRRMFGNDFLENRCVLAFTRGEDLDLQNQYNEEPVTFDEWIFTQHGHLRDLIVECDYRCVLFRNLTLDDEIQEKQRSHLMHHVGNIREAHGNQKYQFGNIFETGRTKTAQPPRPLRESSSEMLEITKNINFVQDDLNTMRKNAIKDVEKKRVEETKDRLILHLESLKTANRNYENRENSLPNTLKNLEKELIQKRPDPSSLEHVLEKFLKRFEDLLLGIVKSNLLVERQVEEISSHLIGRENTNDLN